MSDLLCPMHGDSGPEGGVMSASLRSLKRETVHEATSSERVTYEKVTYEKVAEANREASESIVYSDLELVAQVKSGSRSAFTELVRRHQRGLLRIVLRLTRELPLAEDIVQEAFIKSYEKIDLFEGRSSFKSWLYQIGLNTAKNRFRSRPNEEFTTDIVQGGVAAEAERGLVREDVARRIRSEVDLLPERQRIAITLRVFEDMSFKEIAQIMNCPYDTAKANYRHALLKLREKFEEQVVRGGELEDWNSLFGMDEDMRNGPAHGGQGLSRVGVDHQEVEL